MDSVPPSVRPKNSPLRNWMIAVVITLNLAGTGIGPSQAYAAHSDMNHDGTVDLEDLRILSERHLKQDWQTVDWCAWIEEGGHLQEKHDELVDFIREYFQCDGPPPPGEDPLAVVNENLYPTRLAWGPDGKLYASDAKVQSVFIYELATDAGGQTTLKLTGELKHVGRVLGLAIDEAGVVHTGNSQRRRIERYDLEGDMVGAFGEGTIRMPTDLTFDADGNLYVADSESNVVWVFRPGGSLLRTIRKGGLGTPMGVEIAYVDDGSGNLTGELYVANKADYLVKVFNLQGDPLRSFGGFVRKVGWFNPTWEWHGRFVSIQSLAVDGNGDVHALDVFMKKVQILNRLTGDYLGSYGESGTDPGRLMLPLDVSIGPTGKVVVADADNRRVEIIYEVP